MSSWFGWFDLSSFENGLLTEGIAMAVELVLIVNVLNWLRKRDYNRRLTRYRTRTRKLLSRSLADMESQLTVARDSLSRYQEQLQALEHCATPLPPPAETARLILTIQRTHERLNRDYALYLANLDNPTADVFEAWLEQMEWMLAVWPIWRMTDPDFARRWSDQDTRDEQKSYVKRLGEVNGALMETMLIAASIRGSLLYAETQKGGDDKLLREARALRDGTHALKSARNRKHQEKHGKSD